MNKIKQNSAITLIALVITIIVLLILAAVTLNIVLGENGIFSKARNAKEETEYSTALEEINLIILQAQTEAASQGKTANLKDVVEELKNDTRYTYVINTSKQFSNISQDGTIKSENDINDETDVIYVIHKGYEFEIGNDLKIIEPENKIKQNGGQTQPETPNQTQGNNNVQSRYIIVEVNDHLEGDDCTVINELEIYDKKLNKCSYTIKNDLVYDTKTGGKPEYWENGSYWNYGNLNDGDYEYLSNYPTGNQNCTIFISGSNNPDERWARFIIDLGEEKDIAQIKVCVGGYDDLSSTKTRIPKSVAFYGINNFVEGTSEGSTYSKNIINRNNDGLTLIGNKEFTERKTVATWYSLLWK